MKDGMLNKKEEQALIKARDILNMWIDADIEAGYRADEYTHDLACNAAGGISNFLTEYKDGERR